MDLIKAVSRAISVGGIDHGHRQVVFAMIQIREKRQISLQPPDAAVLHGGKAGE